MDSLLHQLYRGELSPETHYTPYVEAYTRRWREKYFHYEDFAKKLRTIDPALARRFVEIMDEQVDTVPLDVSGMFEDGFCLGVRLMADVYANRNVAQTPADREA